MRSIKCAICNKSEYRILYSQKFSQQDLNGDTYSARRSPVINHYQMVKCLNCGMVFSTPILETSEIEKLYQQSKFNYKTLTKDLQKTYGKYLSILRPSSKHRLLEIGCGNGFFLEKAKELGYQEVYGVEPSSEAIERALPSIRRNILRGLFGPELFSANSFDVVCCFQTLDHIVDPNAFLRDCRYYLKDGGKILCITHNIDALAAKILGERCPMIDIEHIFLFNKSTLNTIFAHNGFTVSNVFDVANTYPLAYYFHLLPIFKHIKLSSSLGNVRLTMKMGNIGIIATKEE